MRLTRAHVTAATEFAKLEHEVRCACVFVLAFVCDSVDPFAECVTQLRSWHEIVILYCIGFVWR